MNDKNCIIINEKNIQCNIKELSKLISPEKLYVVCKSDNYGLGNDILHLLKKYDDYIDGYCVSDIEEAVHLRKKGILKPVIILGIIDITTDLEIIHRLNFEFVIPSLDFFKSIKPKECSLAHLAVDVGLGRIGITEKKELDEIISIALDQKIKFKGIYTHHSSSNKKIIEHENELFNEYLINAREIVNSFHSGSSSSVSSKLDKGNIYRIGAAIFGMYQENSILKNRPIAMLCSKVVHLKKIKAGCAVGYNSEYMCPREGWIVNIPLGYGDGFVSRMKNFKVQVGSEIGIIASVCMNQTMIFVEEKPQINEKVILIGTGESCNNTLFDATNHLGIHEDEFFCQLSKQILRKVR